MNKPKILIIMGSTRQNRQSEMVATYVAQLANKRTDLDFELIDLRDWDLPFYNEVAGPMSLKGNYQNEIGKKWATKVGEADGYIIVTPEYNHGYSAVLKNALDYVYYEWNRKPVAFVSYGALASGARAVEQLRQVAVELQMAPIATAVMIPFIWSAFGEDGKPKDGGYDAQIDGLFTDLAWWTMALKKARENK